MYYYIFTDIYLLVKTRLYINLDIGLYLTACDL